MRVLVVGGAGYIGSHMVKLLNLRGFEVTVLDNLANGHRDAVQGARFVLGDLYEREILDQLFEEIRFDGVMHFASYIQVGESVREPAKYYRNNVFKTQNLLDAMAVAHAPGARGVLVVCAGAVHGARQVQKVHPYRVDAFSSGEGGPLGWVEEGRVRLAQDWPQAQAGWAQGALEKVASGASWPRVEIVMNYAGACGATVDALVRDGVQGLVVAATGNGTLHHALQAALERAQQAGVAVRVTTRCPLGQVLSLPWAHAALPLSPGLIPVKARVSLLLELLGASAPML